MKESVSICVYLWLKSHPDNFATELPPPFCPLSLCVCRGARCPGSKSGLPVPRQPLVPGPDRNRDGTAQYRDESLDFLRRRTVTAVHVARQTDEDEIDFLLHQQGFSRSRKPRTARPGMNSNGWAMVLVSSLTATPMRLVPWSRARMRMELSRPQTTF